MASLLGAFRKLYTSLRKPQQSDEDDVPTDKVTDKSGEPDNNGGDSEPSKDTDTATELVDFVSDDHNKVITAIADIKANLMTDSTASAGSEWEVLPAPIESRSHLGTDVDAPFVHIQGPDDSEAHVGIAVQKIDGKEEKVDLVSAEKLKNAGEDVVVKDKTDKNKKTKKKNICHMYSRGQRCTRRKCPFAHVRDSDSTEGKDKVVKEETEKTDFPHEKDFPSFLDYVCEMTKQSKQVRAKDLIYKLGYMKDTNSQTMGEAIVGQYNVAKGRNHWFWVKDARYFAGLFFEQGWINDHLPADNQKSNKNNRNKKFKKNCNRNENFELPGGMCRDVRLQANPNLETVTANAAGDGPLMVKKEVALGKRNTNLAAGDGKVDTPSKRSKLAKVDISRTPRSRPDQLALGFNYHSDLVVKQSPRTVKGEIIPLDTLPAPRERPEQLAVGFNYLAEQLVRDSPKTETGEVIIPGIVKSPKRRTRDQLAVGFNYHSDLMAKESPNLCTESSEEKKNLKTKKKKAVNLNNRFDCDNENVENSHSKDNSSLKQSSKMPERDTLAFGFSYNSDHFLTVPLKELGGNLADDIDVSSLIEDAVISEGRNLAEVVDDKPVTGLPAGSVW